MPGGELRQPLTRAQQAFWNLQEALPDGPVNVAYYLDLSGPIDISILSEVGREFVARMTTLFIRFETTPSGPMMVHDPSLPDDRTTIDFRGYADPMAAAHAWMVADCARRIDLTRDRTALFGLFHIADDRHLIYMRGHHIISDGASAITNLNHWGRCYTQALTGAAPDYPAPADLTAALTADTDYATSTRRERDREYWREHLAALDRAPSLSRLFAPPAPIPHRVGGRLDDTLLSTIRAVENLHRTGLPAVVATGVAAFLARMSGHSDVTVALPVAARTTAAVRATPLPVSNVVPVRTRLDADTDLADALRRTQSSLLGALRHQRYRYEDIRADLAESGSGAIGTGPGVTGPVLNLMLFEPRVTFGEAVGSVHVISAGPVDDIAITLHHQPRADGSLGAHLDLETNPGRYTHAETVDLHRRLTTMLDAVATGLLNAPDTRIDTLPLIDNTEAAVLTSVVGPPAPRPCTLPELLIEASRRWPERLALAAPGAEWSYRKLTDHVDTVALSLIDRGARAGRVVAIATGRGVWQTVSLWAVARTGASVLLLDPAHPDARITAVLDDAAPLLVLTSADTEQRRAEWLPVEEMMGSAGEVDVAPPHLDDVAYIVYTSGTTGRPKGVALSHRGIASLAADVATRFAGASPRVAQLAAPTFDATLFEHIVAVALGAALVPAPPGVIVGSDLASFLLSQNVTHAVMTPSVMATMTPDQLDGSQLTTLMSAGEALPGALVATWAPHYALHNLYGPAESTVMATATGDLPAGAQSLPTPSIGLPITGTGVHVLDNRLRPVPPGVPGDLYLSGSGLARGYPGDTPMTARRFVANPWGPAGARMYRTGDRVAWEPDLRGLVHLGRADTQIQIRGVRVELGEIEAVAGSHRDVAAAAAVLDTDDETVSLYVSSVSAPMSLRSALRRHLATRLPPVMWPSRIVVLDEFPVTSSGKLDRDALSALVPTDTGVPYRAPASAVETMVADRVSAVLGVADPSMLADVIELGATSLNATQIAAELSTASGAFVSVRDVLASTTLADLASVVAASPRVVGVAPDRPDRPPASPQQLALVVDSRVDPDSTANVLRGRVVARGVSLSTLTAAIADVVERHEILRTIVRLDPDGVLWQDVVTVDEAVGLIVSSVDVAVASDPVGTVPIRVHVTELEPGSVAVDVTAHHIVIDDRSATVLLDDLATAYTARAAGIAPRWSTPAFAYIDATLAAADRLGDPEDTASDHAVQKRFWVDALSGRAARPRLPADVLVAALVSPQAAQQTALIDQALTERITPAARDAGVTTFAVLHAALAAVTSRYSGTDDVWIAVAQAGRDRLPNRPAVGMYVNPVMIRTRIDAHSTFATLTSRSAGALRNALTHSDIPFADVVRAVDPGRDVTEAPLTDVWLSYRDTDYSGWTDPTGDIDVDITELPAEHPRVPLQWNLDRVGDELRVTLTYRSDRVSGALARAMVDAFISAVAAGVDAPERELHHLVPGITSGPAAAAPRPRTLVDLFEATANRHPDRVALIDGDRRWSYHELRKRASVLAGRLSDAGAGVGTTVAVALPRSAESLVAQLAVLMTGAAYIPIDVSYPPSRIAMMLDDSEPVVVVTDAHTAHLADERPTIRCGDDDAPPGRVVIPHPDSAAYVIFTSGSTGRPKGVAVSHRSVAAMLEATGDAFGFDVDDVFSCTHSLSFDFSVFEVFAAWRVGAAVVLVDTPTVLDPVALWNRLVHNDVTVLSQTPSAFYPLADHVVAAAEVAPLRHIVFGGEALRSRRVASFGAAFPGVRLSNLYGLTEAAVHVTTHDVDTDDARSLIAGAVLGDGVIHVLDQWLRPVPAGVWGELYVTGTHLARGYAGAGALTATRFVADRGGARGRMYRTGDVVRRTLDGYLEYGGRSDEQVQVRGFRVELGEVDAALRSVDGVIDAVTTLWNPDRSTGASLIGYVQLDPAAGGRTAADVRAAVSRTLPSYAVPVQVVVMDAWPLTASGKIDRAALPSPAVAEVGVVDPDPGPLQTTVSDVVAVVLGLDADSIDPRRSLIDYGAHSLSYMHIAVALAEATGRRLPVATIAAAPSIIDIARSLAGRPVDETPTASSASDEYTPSPAQRGLWILNRLDPRSTVYHLPAVVETAGELDPVVVGAAIGDLIERHDVLRTTFDERDGEPVARVMDVATVRARVDAMLTPRVIGSDAVREAAETEAFRPFDLTGDLGWRIAGFTVDSADAGSARRSIVLLVAHHVVADGWSLDLLAAYFQAALSARQAGVAPQWSTPPTSYRDHAERTAIPASIDADIDYWRTYLADAPVHMALPRPGTVPAERQGPEPALYLDAEVGAEVRAAAHARAQDADTTLFHLVHLALAQTLATFTGTDDIVIGTPTAGRDTVTDLAGVGMYVRTVVLRSRIGDDATVASALRAGDRTLADARRHSGISYDGIVAALAPARTSDVDPYLDVLLAFAHSSVAAEVPVGGAIPGSFTITPIRVPHARVPLEFSVIDHGPGGGLDVTLIVGTWRVDTAVARRILDHVVAAIEQIAGTPLDAALPVVTAEPAAPLPEAAVALDVPTPVDVIDAVRSWAVSRPDAVAVVESEHSTTYGELQASADSVADSLRGNGIGVGDRVMILGARSAGTIAAVLATLSVGAAYVPVDPDYPPARIAALTAACDPVATMTVRLSGAVDVEVQRSGSGARVVQVPAAAPAYVIYTSGSTGVPKGVVLTRGNLAAMIAAAVPVVGATDADVWSWFHSPAFDYSVWEMFGALSTGGRIVVVDPDVAHDPALVAALIEREHVTVLSQTPTAFARLVDLDFAVRQATSVRWVVFGGEAVIPESLAAWHRAVPAVGLANMYGITETTVHLTHGVVDTRDRRSIVGAPLPGVELHVLDRRLRPVPIGARGEVYVVGDQVASGYLGETGLTAERFVASPFGIAGTRMYRTGDHARQLDDGSIEYLGRVDRQVQLRGFRVELGEVAAVLRADDTVADVRVAVRPGPRVGDETLVAFVIARSEHLDTDHLRRACAATLPAHLVPSSVHPVTEWPLTTSGKLDVAALLATLTDVDGADRPLTATEEVVAATIAAVTGVEPGRLGGASNFFDLGGNSLSAARLAAALGDVTPGISVREVFDHPTVAMLAVLVDRPRADARPAGPPPTARPRPARLPLTPQQEEIWLQWRLDPADTGYHLTTMIPLRTSGTVHVDLDSSEIDGVSMRDRVTAAVRIIVDRHDALRTSYPEDADGPHQRLWDRGEVDVSLPTVPVTDRDDATAHLRAPFDLAVQLPWRAAVYTFGDTEVLGVAVHHIAVDGHSIAILERELADALAGRDVGPAPMLDVASYTQWYLESLAQRRPVLDAFWAGIFTDPPGALRLPGVVTSSTVAHESDSDLVVSAALPPDLLPRLGPFAARNHTTVFMVVHAALAALLARRADTDDITIGTATSGRVHDALTETVGMVARTVPLRTRVDVEASFIDVLAGVTSADLDSFAHADLPAGAIAAHADPSGTGAGSAVTPVFLADLTRPSGLTAQALATTARADTAEFVTALDGPRARFGLDFAIVGGGDGTRIALIHPTSMLDAATAQGFVDDLVGLIEGVVDDPGAPVVDHLLGSADEPAPASEPITLGEILARAASDHTDRIALRDGIGTELTYGALQAWADEVAADVTDRGIGLGDLVAIHAPRSSMSVVGMWAVAATGAAFVHLDPDDPLARRQGVVGDARPRVGVYAGPSAPDGFDVEWIPLQRNGDPTGRASTQMRPRPDDLAYVTYTSGTTGTPKGVMVTHRGLRDLVESVIATVGIGADSVVSHTHATTFDAHLIELLPALTVGATVVICPPDVIGGDELTRVLDDARVSVFFSTPSVLTTLQPDTLTSVETVVVGGEGLPDHVAREWSAGRRMVNFYGPTETTVAATGEVVGSGPVTIGVGLDGVSAYVLDRRLRPVPDDTVGELYLAGPGLARGYLGRPDQTAARFVPVPFSTVPHVAVGAASARMCYRTGDVVHRRRDGRLVIHGRTDDQLTLRGVRLEPAEIEAALRSEPTISAAAAGLSRTASGVEVLTAWVIPADAAVDPASIRDALRDRLPRRLIPAVIEIVDDFPRTRGGKLDRSALTRTTSADPLGGPLRTPHELAVAKVWSEVVGVPADSLTTLSDFFAIGGTSLRAIRAIARLREHTGRSITVRQLFDARSVGDLARLLDAADVAAPTVAPEHLPVPADLPLSYPQRRLWILNRIDPQSTAYTVPVVLRITGDLDLDALRTAVAELPARHDSLRTVYPDTPDGPRQIVTAALTELPRVRRVPAESVEEVIAEIVSAPFDLTVETGFRAEIVEPVARPSEWLLVIAMHHVAVDGWSMRTLLTELLAAYVEGPDRDRATDLTYTDFTQWQFRHLGDPTDPTSNFRRQLDFWTDTLAGAGAPIRLPGAAATGTVLGRGGRVHTDLDDDLVAGLSAFAASESATLYHLAHSALASLIGAWTGRRDLVIGAPVLGRGDDPAWEPVVGMFVNTLALRTILDPDASIVETLHRVRDVDLAATAHDDVPYDAVARAVRPDHRGRHDPLISVLLVQQDVGAVFGGHLDIGVDGVTVELAGNPELLVGAKFDIEVVFGQLPGEPLGVTVVHSGAVPPSIAQRLLDDYVTLLRAVVADPTRPFPRAGDLPEAGSSSVRVDPATDVPDASNPELTQLVRDAMGEVLAIAPTQIGPDDDFFTLGGTSLSATQVVSIVGRRLDRTVPVGALFDDPTPRGLARTVGAGGGASSTPLGSIPRPRRSDPVPLTAAQRRTWFVDQIVDGGSMNAVPVAVEVPPGVDDDRVRAALRAVTDRHAPLRTIYPATSDGPTSFVLGSFTPPLTVLGALGDPVAAVSTAITAGFDITLLPPVRAVLIGAAGEYRALVVVVHHIAMDGASVPILTGDLRAAMAGQWLTPLDVGYPTVAVWESVVAADNRFVELAHWDRELTGYSGILDLPTDRPRGADRSRATATIRVDAGRESMGAESIGETARATGLTSFQVVHAALAITLASWAGVDDVAVGAPASSRRHPETADMVGMFVSTVVLRTPIGPGTTLLDFLRRVRDTDAAALDHVLVGFDEIVARVNPPRDPGRHPLVQVMISQVDVAGVTATGPDLQLPSPDSEFDLQLTVSGSPGDPGVAEFTYSTALFDPVTIEAVAQRWLRALDRIAAAVRDGRAGDVTVDDIDLRGDDEIARHAALATVWSSRLPITLGDILSAAVHDHPGATALESPDLPDSLTYAELDRWSAQVARALLDRGVGSGDRVAVAVTRSAESVVALWAIARIAAIYAPIDPRYPTDRVQRMLDIIDPAVAIVGADENAAVTARIDMPVVRVRPFANDADGDEIGWAPASVDAVAYIVFTSGSTGVPNAVSVTHRGLAFFGDPTHFALRSSDRVAHVANPGFDAALMEILLATAAGACLVIVAPDRVGGSVGTAELARRGVTAMFITPAVLATLDERALPALRTILVGGEAVPRELLRIWRFSSGPDRRVWVVYGPTETTMIVTRWAASDARVLIGDVIDTVATHVLDLHLRPVPDGVVGELYLMGPALAQGYHRADLTAARFVAAADGARMYRTGDRVRRTPDGLEFVGRTDTQRQIRGLRVEPGEIDAVLVGAGAARSATIVAPGPVGDVLVSYVVAAPDDLIGAAARRLPPHMVPAQIVDVDELPLTPIGKLDVAALPTPTWEIGVGGPARTDTEAAVLETLRNVLGLTEMGIGDDYFASGGTSLQLAQVTAELQTRLGTRIPIATIFTHPTAAGLAAAIDSGVDALAALAPCVPLRDAPQQDSAAAPLWCVHPVGGLALDYRPLADALAWDGTAVGVPQVWGLQLPGLADTAVPMPTTIADLARAHLLEVTARQPRGPYRLLGWSVGGQLVHEMARQLGEAGHRVELLVLLDPRMGADIGGDFETDGVGIDAEIADRLEAIDPLRFADYRRRVQVLAAAAAVHEPGVVDVDTAIYVAARDNNDPGRWADRVAGPLRIEASDADHAGMGAPGAMAAVGAMLALLFLPPARPQAPIDEEDM